MLNNLEVIIGIENHVELKTKTKMFSPSPIIFGAHPNTAVHEIDLGYPGAMPSVNKEGVRLALLATNALKMTIDPLLIFDRKNYFYPDLAKGFQITQQFHPIGKEGKLEIQLSDMETKMIAIERLHIEEDTAKQIHKGDQTYLDYNRSGIGLIEIVTKPVMRSADEAVAYVEKLRETLLYLGVSDVKMNEGSLRCDVNISLRPYGKDQFGSKVEIKNLNSLMNVRKAIDFEIKRQTEILLNNQVVIQETRRFDEATQTTISMRSKADAIDYRYVAEPNITPIALDPEWIESVIATSPQLADEKRTIFQKKYGLKLVDINLLLTSREMTTFFEEVLSLTKPSDASKVLNYLLGDIQSELNTKNEIITDTKITPAKLAKLIEYFNANVISSKHFKTLIPLAMRDEASIDNLIEENHLKLIADPKILQNHLQTLIDQNQSVVAQYQERPERVLKTIMGQLMKITQGNASPDIAQQILVALLKSK
ncbi:aspartyl/glutamyl-tRNA(Asn/Gln) amidotransferase subunit B [Entomoplasma freundtii]|uniref:Aspartyl/glutamyl-tRNA(Asn/Gln) amidotransferase subunit B n=1 Tax=Entomoplasma freundtii TaxID=74700 RepID=A0A2K8NVG2_9MOLU|nr:Asp-tRNA(Asn)/Glu-tRNA(Gln) amidotransferase subunit GatB [Entomoplasma freundtii]ATZ16623.1 aspartyl/glutamyl-tRNA amidotransferase subunit B [Entomoplasma freundtii]TDY58210.1 aspartyl/glutamyl-tRNA(Asn/Gln) amidotransferase subunit B [Entomoplasma freundtii]